MIWRRKRGPGPAQKSAKFDLACFACDVQLWGRRWAEVTKREETKMDMDMDVEEEEEEAEEVETGSRDDVRSSRAGAKSAKFVLACSARVVQL